MDKDAEKKSIEDQKKLEIALLFNKAGKERLQKFNDSLKNITPDSEQAQKLKENLQNLGGVLMKLQSGWGANLKEIETALNNVDNNSHTFVPRVTTPTDASIALLKEYLNLFKDIRDNWGEYVDWSTRLALDIRNVGSTAVRDSIGYGVQLMEAYLKLFEERSKHIVLSENYDVIHKTIALQRSKILDEIDNNKPFSTEKLKDFNDGFSNLFDSVMKMPMTYELRSRGGGIEHTRTEPCRSELMAFLIRTENDLNSALMRNNRTERFHNITSKLSAPNRKEVSKFQSEVDNKINEILFKLQQYNNLRTADPVKKNILKNTRGEGLIKELNAMVDIFNRALHPAPAIKCLETLNALENASRSHLVILLRYQKDSGKFGMLLSEGIETFKRLGEKISLENNLVVLNALQESKEIASREHVQDTRPTGSH